MAPGHGRHARRAERVGGWIEDRLPPAFQGRTRVGPSQLTVVAVLVTRPLRADAAGPGAARTVAADGDLRGIRRGIRGGAGW